MKKILSVILAIVMLISTFVVVPFTLQAATMPSCSGQKSSNVTTNSARVDFTIKNPSCLTIKTCGMQIRKKGSSSWTTKSETVTSSYQKKSSIPVWYTIGNGKEFNYTLFAGTTYEYRGFCKYGSNTYYTSVSTFTTTKSTTMPSCTGQKSSGVSTNSARVDFTIKNPSCLTIKTCGMQIRKKGSSSWTTKSETVASSYQKSSSIPVWYTIGKGKEFDYTLSAGTTYEYRGFCKYNNNTYYTSVSTLVTTKSTTTSSTYTTKYQAFIKDRRWKNNISWNGSQKPKLSTYDAKGCCAYVCDFCKYVYGYNSYKSAKSTFTSVSSIKTGDVLNIYNSKWGTHWIVVLTRSGNTLYTAEGNAYYNSKGTYSRTVIGNSYYSISGNSLKRSGVGTYSLTKGYHMM
jgi:hypothetical protein